MIFSFLGKNFVRRQLLNKTHSSIMKGFLKEPFPNKNNFIRDIDIISLDIETTGLDPDTDRILSIGLVEINDLGIKLNSCLHQLIQINKNIPEKSVVIHNITDDQLVKGKSVEEVIPVLLELLKGKVMLVHNANVEQGFINKICQKLYATDFVIPIIDTQLLAKRQLNRRSQPYKSNELRLFNIRKKFNMPAYKAHNALMDAIATAELFLAMVNEISPKNNARLKEFLS